MVRRALFVVAVVGVGVPAWVQAQAPKGKPIVECQDHHSFHYYKLSLREEGENLKLTVGGNGMWARDAPPKALPSADHAFELSVPKKACTFADGDRVLFDCAQAEELEIRASDGKTTKLRGFNARSERVKRRGVKPPEKETVEIRFGFDGGAGHLEFQAGDCKAP